MLSEEDAMKTYRMMLWAGALLTAGLLYPVLPAFQRHLPDRLHQSGFKVQGVRR
ncbi:uncharacterized protein Dmul_26460 [Desulfococcus multivorans]|nr:uncharacterized protein Dmul_26460 [Desulfococcus multivorans]